MIKSWIANNTAAYYGMAFIGSFIFPFVCVAATLFMLVILLAMGLMKPAPSDAPDFAFFFFMAGVIPAYWTAIFCGGYFCRQKIIDAILGICVSLAGLRFLTQLGWTIGKFHPGDILGNFERERQLLLTGPVYVCIFGLLYLLTALVLKAKQYSALRT